MNLARRRQPLVALLFLGSSMVGCRNRDAAAVTGTTAVAELRDFSSTVLAIGALRPRIGAEVRVGSRISGRVQRLRANIGDRVEKGQVIAEFETGTPVLGLRRRS